MAADTNYRLLPCSELANILKTKGITYSNKKKEDLIHLCESAEALNLPDVEKCVDSVETRTSLSRRTVDGKTYPHPLFESILTWNNNLRSVPSVDAYDVTCFLVKYCGWSDERVKRRKSDNSWQLHCSGHIHDVKMSMLEPDLCYLLGKCVPETKQSSQPYTPWVLVKKSGQILSAECTCVAGDGSCKHVAALLFGIVDLVLSIEDRSSIGVTDTAAYWDKPRKVCRPIDVHNLDIRTDAVKNEKARASEESGYLPLKPDLLDKKRMEKDIIKVLKDSNTPGVGLYTLSDSEDESDEDMSFFVENYPLNVSDLITNHGVENVSSKITDSYISEVNDLTKGQSANTMWQYQRKGRLTASNFYSASHYRGDSIDNYIVKQVLGLSQFTSEATKHGKTQEPIARTKYTDLMLKHHPSFQCDETGLFVYKDYPFLAASPDGVVKCKCCAKGLVEIKCPYTFHNESPQVAMSKSPSCVMGDGGYELKKTLSSPYYVQMLGQMGVTNSPYCDFVLYTQKDLYVERVEFNAQHWETLSEKLKNFYIQFVLPHLV